MFDNVKSEYINRNNYNIVAIATALDSDRYKMSEYVFKEMPSLFFNNLVLSLPRQNWFIWRKNTICIYR
jgi:hypothetical protein